MYSGNSILQHEGLVWIRRTVVQGEKGLRLFPLYCFLACLEKARVYKLVSSVEKTAVPPGPILVQGTCGVGGF